MTPRVLKLRQESFDAQPSISVERAVLVTQFYRENHVKYSIPVLRALNFKNLFSGLPYDWPRDLLVKGCYYRNLISAVAEFWLWMMIK